MATVSPPPKSGIQVPEWEHENAAKHGATARQTQRGANKAPKRSLASRFDAVVPPHRIYLGVRRRTFLIIVAGTALAVVILIIGLAAGLSKRKSSQDLPLPSNTKTFTGDLTYYGPGLGACGVTSSDSDDIVSVSHIIFDAASTGSNPNANPLCGRKIRATRFDEQVNAQRSIDLTVVDRCTGCKSTDLDTSPGAFDKVAAQASGRVSVTWAWLTPAATGK